MYVRSRPLDASPGEVFHPPTAPPRNGLAREQERGAAEALTSAFPRSAVVHDWLTVPGGSEKVLLELLRLLPRSDVFTSVCDRETWRDLVGDHAVHTSFLDRLPGARRHYPYLLPLMNAAFESFDLGERDLVISSSHSCAKNVVTGPGTLHVCYCHTPMRHAWDGRFLAAERPRRVQRGLMQPMLGRLRRQDVVGALRPDLFVANSAYVAERIGKYYRRPAQVIHPPVSVERHLARPRAPEDYYLVLGRLVPYKRVDLAIAACEALGRRLKIVGTGRARARLMRQAGTTTEFAGYLSDEDVGRALSGARALLFPGEEDFGIVPVEAQAAGVPVVAYGRGGARETVIDGVTGVLHAEQTVRSLSEAILRFEQMEFDEAVVRDNARRFGPARFREEMTGLLLEQAALRHDH